MHKQLVLRYISKVNTVAIIIIIIIIITKVIIIISIEIF